MASHSTTITIEATPAEPARPSTGARRKASPPNAIAIAPIQRPNPSPDTSEMWSPSASSPNTIEPVVAATARIAIESQSRVRCPASFSRAIRCLPRGVVATMSRLPRRASEASVDDRAMIDHRAVPITKMAPYFQVM